MSATHEYINSLILNHFKNKKISIVDYGCGNGELLRYLNNRKIINYTGYDVNTDSLLVARKLFKNNEYQFKKIVNKKVPNFGKPQTLDLVVLVGVLQYMSGDEINELLKQIKKVLSKNGTAIFSCSIDHLFYKVFNLYRFLIPNHYINKELLINRIQKYGFTVELEQEKGLLIAPLFSNILSLFFDSVDKLLFRTRGSIGPIGNVSRKLIDPILKIEYKLPINYGYTLFLKIKKN